MEDSDLNELANEIFQTFARFEYALKTVGFHKGNGNALPDWGAFARSIPAFPEAPVETDLKAAIEYILHHPPKKQVIVDGVLSWRVVEPTSGLKSDKILIYVRRVRNNLFHGGKFNGHWFEPERSQLLLQHCLTILRSCLEESNELMAAYDG